VDGLDSTRGRIKRSAYIELLARVLHESGREAVERRLIYRSDLPIRPFAEWNELTEDAQEGRRLMAKFLLDYPGVVIGVLVKPVQP